MNTLSQTAPLDQTDIVARIEAAGQKVARVQKAAATVIFGQEQVIQNTMITLLAGGHALLIGVPGLAKTRLVETLGAVLGLDEKRVQCTPDLMPADVTGPNILIDTPAGGREFRFERGPIFAHIVLADEINRATPKTQSALLEVMEERTVTVDGTTHKMADPFQVLATMNPQDHDGTFPLPAAQIDRFMVMLELGYPSPEDEVRVLDTHLASDPAATPMTPIVSVESFVEWQRTVPLIHASPDVKRAAVAYVDGLRRSASNGHMVSPRATLAWMRAAQARAILAGREFVTVEDLLDMAPDVLRHRLWMSAPEVRDRLRHIDGRAAGQRR